MRNFRDKNVLITGAGSGIGQATALAFADAGARLWLVDIQQAAVDASAEQARQRGAMARSFVCNVADPQAVQALADEIHAHIDALDILMNNAGIASAGRFLDASLDTWRRVMDVNLMGVVHGCQAFLPKMVERQQGHVVNTSSAAAFIASPDMPIYSASKFAVQGFTEALRADMAQHKIGVTAICPGIINTPIVANATMEGNMAAGKAHQNAVDFYKKRNYTPAQVAKVILKAVRNNVAVQPVSPGAWGMYLSKRLAPRVVSKLSEFELPMLK